MACSQGRGLVEEEQLRVAPGRHDLPAASPELPHAVDPPLPDELAPDRARRVVQAASVAHERATRGRGDQLTERRDTVLAGHGATRDRG
jgi:hypothetical protein